MKQASDIDVHYMQRALILANKAQEHGEVPVGVVIVQDNQVVGEAFNSPISNHDATAHAEILAIRAACEKTSNYRLPNTSAYLTLEPCAMCAGALVHARVDRVIIATKEPRAGAAGSILNVLQNDNLNHRCEVEYGLFQKESTEMLKSFFKSKRK